ncbi:MAG: energy transducer TonB [Verrucomicrobiota bacterium]|jgi:protein TonB
MLTESYQLHSDLARVCLPDPQGHPQRTLAWLNSICFLFLLVALSGVRPGLPVPRPVPALDEPVPIVVQPLPQKPPPQAEQPDNEESTKDKTPLPRVVVVTPDSPAISFSVPTIGNVLVPNAIAQAPPAASPNAPAVVHNKPTTIGSTGEGGDRPQPPYPEMALKFGEQGAVVLLFTVDDSGLVESITVKESSGSAILDRSALDFVKRHWIVPPGRGGRVFQATISYQIKID